jgi:hypothetical protein
VPEQVITTEIGVVTHVNSNTGEAVATLSTEKVRFSFFEYHPRWGRKTPKIGTRVEVVFADGRMLCVDEALSNRPAEPPMNRHPTIWDQIKDEV